MSHWGYVIEQLINEDEKSRIAREHRRKRRLAGAVGRDQTSSADDARPAKQRRMSWAVRLHRS